MSKTHETYHVCPNCEGGVYEFHMSCRNCGYVNEYFTGKMSQPVVFENSREAQDKFLKEYIKPILKTMNIEELQAEITGYEQQKEAIEKEIAFKKAMIKSLDKKIKAVKELMEAAPKNGD